MLSVSMQFRLSELVVMELTLFQRQRSGLKFTTPTFMTDFVWSMFVPIKK